MRIVYVLTSLGVGGAERLVIALGERMRARGHTVALLVLRPPLAEQCATRLPTFHLNMRRSPASLIGAIPWARRFLGAFSPGLVHSHGFHGNMMARILHLTGAAPAPITTIHNVYEGGRARMWAYRLTDRLSCQTVAVSAAAAQRFVRLKAVPERRCIVIANGIDTDEFTPDPARRERMRSEMRAGKHFVWLAAGRIVPAKDYPNLLRAFACVQSTIGATQLWIAGEATDAAAAELNSLIAELGLIECVRPLGLRSDMPALLDAVDAFVLGSAWEGMPLAVGEAMAMEQPVVATDVGGTRELVGEAGLLVPARNPEALAEAMLRVMRMSHSERCTLGQSARLRITASFSLEAKAAEWEALYAGPIKS
jgi:glycosyltransferase involved in cell wall biosynthesis